VDFLADEAQGGFEVARGGLEGVGVDRERSPEHDERGAVFRTAHGLFEREPADGLDGDVDRLDDLAELVQRAGHAEPAGGDAAAFVVADVVDDEIAAKVLAELGAGDHVGAAEVVAHDLRTMVTAGLHDDLESFFVGAGHDDHVGGACLGHHLRLEVAAVHRLEVGHNGRPGEGLPQRPHTVQALGEDQRRPGLQPVDAGTHRHRSRFERLIDVRQV